MTPLYQTHDCVLQLDAVVGGVATTIVKTIIFGLVISGRSSDAKGILDPELLKLCVGALLVDLLLGHVQKGVLILPSTGSPIKFLSSLVGVFLE